MKSILVLNSGSSSLKFSVFQTDPAGAQTTLVAGGQIARQADGVAMEIRDGQGAMLVQTHEPDAGAAFDAEAALARVVAWLDTRSGNRQIDAIGHRVVHGGDQFFLPVIANPRILQALMALIPLAPSHQGHNLAGVELTRTHWPDAIQVLCFDTAFHHGQPSVARACALPRSITALGIQRYGFHGLSFESIVQKLPEVLGSGAQGRVLVAHLGNGASLCALVEGRSQAATMGFSVLDGLMMGSRCGTLDAGVVLYLLQHLQMSAEQVSAMLYEESGLLGVSGVSSDMATLLGSSDPHAAEALDLFVYRVAGEIGQMTAAMGGIDALVFTAGIGENAPEIRARICAACGWLGAVLDECANSVDLELIHARDSKLQIAVVRTDEEAVIAGHTARLARLVASPVHA